MDFTKIRWAGRDCVLITSTNNNDPQIPLLVLTKDDVKKIRDLLK